MKATDTERFILNALLQGYGSLKDLGRKTRTKIETLMNLYVKHIEIAPQDYTVIQSQLLAYINGTAQSDATDSDQPSPIPVSDWVAAAESAEQEELLL